MFIKIGDVPARVKNKICMAQGCSNCPLHFLFDDNPDKIACTMDYPDHFEDIVDIPDEYFEDVPYFFELQEMSGMLGLKMRLGGIT